MMMHRVSTHTCSNTQIPTHMQYRGEKEFWLSSSYFTPDLCLDGRPAGCQQRNCFTRLNSIPSSSPLTAGVIQRDGEDTWEKEGEEAERVAGR